MRLLVIGSGGREHALAWRLSQSSEVQKLYVAPGNPGMESDKITIVPLATADHEEVLRFCRGKKIDFIVVGPDQALADGLVDSLEDAGFLAFGPRKEAAKLEWSKAFAKEVMEIAHIPTAEFVVVEDFGEALDWLTKSRWEGWVVKADGLALGKGVVVCKDKAEAQNALERFIHKREVGIAANRVVIEELLEGPEVSAFYLCDGERAISLGFACDYKQLLDGGRGPNTGGMGAYSPVDWLGLEDENEILQKIVEPLLAQMRSRRTPFKGILFVGLMMTKAGPKVLEFNVRFGDPETQCLMPRIRGDFLGLLLASARGNLDKKQDFSLADSSVHVVLAAHGYPGTTGIPVRKGDPITIDSTLDAHLFFAGISGSHDKGFVTNGGRVLGVTATAPSIQLARQRAYAAAKKIYFEGLQMRRDIGE